VVERLPSNPDFLGSLLRELRRACGTGGTVRERSVELQGDHRERLRTILEEKGWVVRG